MSNPVEDFIISLGFDTSKVKAQIQTLHKELEKLAVNVDAKRVKQALTTQKTIGNNEVKVTKDTAKAKEKVQTAADKKRIAAEKQVQKTIADTRKQAALRSLRNQIAEYERSTTGPSNLSNRYKYYERGNASLAKIRAFTEEIRGKNTDTRNRMKAEGSLKSFDSAASSKAEMDMMKASNALEVLRTRMSKMGMQTTNLDKQLVDAKDLNSMKRLIEQTKHQINLEKELNKGRQNLTTPVTNGKRTRVASFRESADMRTLRGSKDSEVRGKTAKFLSDYKSAVKEGKVDRLPKIKQDVKDYVKELKLAAKVKSDISEHDAHITAFQKQQARLAKKQAAETERELKRQQKLAALKPTQTNITALMQRYRANGLMQGGGEDAIMAGAMKQSTQKQADAYIKASLRAMEYSNKGVGNKKDTMRIISEGNVQVLSKANMQLAAMNAKMAAVERRAIGAAAAFGGMHDSARNAVREMASVYAIMAGTGYAKEQVKALDSMNASVLAVSDSSEQSAETVAYLKTVIKQNGLSLKDTTKDFVKLRAAMQDQHSLTETQAAFESLTKSGVILQLSQDDMSGTVKAVSQIYRKGLPPQ